MRIAATADWHVGPSRQRLDPATGLNARLLDFSRVAKWTVEDAIERGAGLIVHCGDVWHGCRPTPTEVRLVKDALAPAHEAAVPVVILVGNHDSPRTPTEQHALDLLRDEDGVLVVDRPCLLNVMWNGERGYVYEAGRYDMHRVCQLACLPWPNTNLLLADADVRGLEPAARNLLIREKLMDVLRGLAAQRAEGVPCLLLAHAGVDTAEMGKTNTLAMLGGDWTLNVYELQALGFDAVVLGHYHKPQMLTEEPWVGYCGSPEAVTAGEEGERKHYLLWDVPANDWPSCEAVETPYRRFRTMVQSDFGTELDGALRVIEEATIRDQVIRVVLPETAKFSAAEYRRVLEAAGAHDISVEIIRAETQRRRETSVSASTPPPEALDGWLQTKTEYAPMRDELQTELAGVEQQRGGINATE